MHQCIGRILLAVLRRFSYLRTKSWSLYAGFTLTTRTVGRMFTMTSSAGCLQYVPEFETVSVESRVPNARVMRTMPYEKS